MIFYLSFKKELLDEVLDEHEPHVPPRDRSVTQG